MGGRERRRAKGSEAVGFSPPGLGREGRGSSPAVRLCTSPPPHTLPPPPPPPLPPSRRLRLACQFASHVDRAQPFSRPLVTFSVPISLAITIPYTPCHPFSGLHRRVIGASVRAHCPRAKARARLEAPAVFASQRSQAHLRRTAAGAAARLAVRRSGGALVTLAAISRGELAARAPRSKTANVSG